MKRKNKQYLRRVVLGDIAFDFALEEPAQVEGVTLASEAHYKFVFRPPCEHPRGYLKVTHLPSTRCDIRMALDPEHRVVDGDFYVYETHAFTRDGSNMYLAIENAQLLWWAEYAKQPVYRPVFDLGIRFWPPEQYVRLPFVPADNVDGVDSSLVAQHNPFTAKRRGQITSASFYKYLGFYVPTVEEDPKYNMWRAKPPTWADIVRMRFGSLREQYMIHAYIKRFKTRCFHQTGYHTHPDNGDVWGASPDGIILDLATGERRTVEFKGSRSDCDFKGYHYAQIVWEMACLDVQNGELVRYSEEPNNDNSPVRLTCRIATIARDLALENESTQLACAAKNVRNSRDFQILVHTQPYLDMRKRFDDLAAALPREEIPADHAMMQEIEDYTRSIYQLELPEDRDEIEERHMLIRQLIRDNKCDRLDKLVEMQIEAYRGLFKV